MEWPAVLWYLLLMSASVKKEGDFFSFLAERSAEIIGGENLKKEIKSGKKLRVKLGLDPTNPDLHLGHVVPLRILRAFQDAGHQAVVIIGDFTGGIGDPSGRVQVRRQLAPKEIKQNEKTYRAQIGKIIDLQKAELRHNRQWFGKMKLSDFLNLAANFTLKSSCERQDFQKRLAQGREVRLHEAMYHVLQAYDSVMVKADVELGALDQKLNLISGRDLQSKMGLKPQDIVLAPYLIGLDGRQKMSKSVGNTINLRDSAEEMLGKTMSIPDRLILNYAELAAWLSSDEIRKIERRLASGENPRDVKLDVAEAVAALYHGVKRARKARGGFLRVFSGRKVPTKAPSADLAKKNYEPAELILALKAASSKSQARRLIRGKALEVDGRTVEGGEEVKVNPGSVIRVGKKKFFRVK